MTLPNDPADALRWAFTHSNEVLWVLGVIAAGIAWTSKRMRDWSRRNAIAIGQAKLAATRWTPGPPSQAPAAASAAPLPPAAPAQPASASAASQVGSGRKLHRGAPQAQQAAAPAQRAVTPVARSVNVPVRNGAWTLADAFGDPAHARTAVVIAEVLGPPLGLR